MTNEPKYEPTQAEWAKALSHPLRVSILQELGLHERSPSDLARVLGASLGVVSYHVRMLAGYGMLDLTRTEPRRGALEHFYRAASVAPPLPDLDTLRTQLGAMFGVTGEHVTVIYSEEPGLRTFEIQAQVPVDNMMRGGAS